MKILALILPLTTVDTYKKAVGAIADVLNKINPAFVESAITDFIDDIMALEISKVLEGYRSILEKSVNAEHFSAISKKIIKTFSKSINHADSDNYNKPLETIFANFFIAVFERNEAS